MRLEGLAEVVHQSCPLKKKTFLRLSSCVHNLFFFKLEAQNLPQALSF